MDLTLSYYVINTYTELMCTNNAAQFLFMVYLDNVVKSFTHFSLSHIHQDNNH